MLHHCRVSNVWMSGALMDRVRAKPRLSKVALVLLVLVKGAFRPIRLPAHANESAIDLIGRTTNPLLALVMCGACTVDAALSKGKHAHVAAFLVDAFVGAAVAIAALLLGLREHAC